MSRKQNAIFMGIGVLAGFALSGPAAQAANIALTAAPTSQTFYVNGQQTEFEAYQIHSNNFVKLRDIGRAVDFGVTYDAATNTVHIVPGSRYVEEVTSPAPIPSSAPATSVTEESVQVVLAGLEQTYPHMATSSTPYSTISNGPYTKGVHCAGWAALCSEAAFGTLPWQKVDLPTWDQLRPGDIVEYRNEESYHAVVIVEKREDCIFVTESSTSNMVLWGGQYFRWWLEKQPRYVCYTRYPQ